MSPPPSQQRVHAVDWLRGLAVPVMIQTHALVLLSPEARQSVWLSRVLRVDGLSTTTFYFAAGFALALLQVRTALGGGQKERLGKTLRRIGQVLLTATFVNWMWFPLFREPHWLWRLDILHSIGLCLLVALVFTAPLAKKPVLLQTVALVLGLSVFAFAPFAEGVRGPFTLFFNKTSGSAFPLFPWLGHVFLGVFLGSVSATQGAKGLTRALLGIMALGIVFWPTEHWLRQLYPPVRLTSSLPSDAAQRFTCLFAVLLGLMWLEKRGASPKHPALRFLTFFGTCSLSAYVIHEALLYYRFFGLSFEVLWGRRSGWGLFTALTLLLIGLTYVLCQLLDKAQRHFKQAKARRAESKDAAWVRP